MDSPSPRIIQLASGREWRGGERQVALLAGGLASRVDQVVVTNRGSRLERELLSRKIAVRSVRWRMGVSPAALVATVREARRGPAIIHAHDGHAVSIAAAAARITSQRFVVTRRVTFPIRRPALWARAAQVIAISSAIREELITAGLPDSRVTVIHSAIDLDETRKIVPARLHQQLGLDSNDRLAVTVAGLEPEKNHATLIETASRLRKVEPNLHWVFVGDGSLRSQLENLVDQRGLRDRVHFVGEVPDPRPLIAASQVFILASTEEGLGTSILDAMALGVPVIGSETGGIPELIGGGSGILCPALDVAAFALAIGEVLHDHPLQRRLVGAASERVRSFGVEGMTAAVLAVYRSLSIER